MSAAPARVAGAVAVRVNSALSVHNGLKKEATLRVETDPEQVTALEYWHLLPLKPELQTHRPFPLMPSWQRPAGGLCW